MTNDKQRKLRILKQIAEHKPYSVITLICDALGLPYSRFWRRRITDAKRDGCCEWVPEPKQSKSKLK